MEYLTLRDESADTLSLLRMIQFDKVSFAVAVVEAVFARAERIVEIMKNRRMAHVKTVGSALVFVHRFDCKIEISFSTV